MKIMGWIRLIYRSRKIAIVLLVHTRKLARLSLSETISCSGSSPSILLFTPHPASILPTLAEILPPELRTNDGHPPRPIRRVLGTTSTEISSVALGGRILSTSDEWFAPASSLLKVGPAPSLKGQFGPKERSSTAWETRRHNPTYDWVILRLGPNAGGRLVGFDVDTANFNGNEAPEISIHCPRTDARGGGTDGQRGGGERCEVGMRCPRVSLWTVAEASLHRG